MLLPRAALRRRRARPQARSRAYAGRQGNGLVSRIAAGSMRVTEGPPSASPSSIASAGSLWSMHAHRMHVTSARRFPAFRAGQNDRRRAATVRTSLLREPLDGSLVEEARVLAHAIWVPCGPKAVGAVNEMVRRRHPAAEGGSHLLSKEGLPELGADRRRRVLRRTRVRVRTG